MNFGGKFSFIKQQSSTKGNKFNKLFFESYAKFKDSQFIKDKDKR